MTAPEDIKDRVAIVTGGGRGLGRAMALGLAQAGMKVVVTAARETGEIEAVAGEAPAGAVLPLTADVIKPADAVRAVETAVDEFGRLDVLVNNAGRGMRYVSETFMTEPTRFWETAPEVWRMVIDTNVNGPFLMARAAAPRMMAAGWGRIVNISMLHSTMRLKGFTPYGPSKAALESETVIWAKDLADTGVTVNALLPGGPAMTGMIPPVTPTNVTDKLLAPEIMVPPLLWLASRASDGITGKRFDAAKWPAHLDPNEAAVAAMDDAGWVV